MTRARRVLQPLLHDLSVTLTAPTVVLSRPDGDLDATADGAGAQGMFHADVRAVSLLRVRVRAAGDGTGGDGTDGNGTDGGWVPADPLVAAADGPGRARFVGLLRALGDEGADPTVRLERERVVGPGRLEERFVVRSAASAPLALDLRVEVGGDLRAIEHVKAGLLPGALVPARRHAGDEAGPSTGPPADESRSGRPDDACLEWSDGEVEVRVVAPGAVAEPGGAALTWRLTVRPGGTAACALVVDVRDAAAVVVPAATDASWHRPSVRADDRRLAALVAHSLDDLHSLRMAAAGAPQDTFLAAGAPWFFTLFGRDSLWAARMLLPLGTGLALGTLRALAARQGVRTDPATEEEPGKILHEVRRGTFDTSGELRLPPLYYGSVDATPLWVCLLHDAWRWGLPDDDVRSLLPALEAALEWVAAAAADGDGFLRYLDHAGSGLANQGWKDSGDAVRFADGSTAAPPVALAEVQGYAFEAARHGADLLDAFGRPGADRWRAFASDLADRFRARLWVTSDVGPYPAMALDGSGRVVDAVASNMGHLLGTGILAPDEAAHVAARLVADDMSGGYGLRTMSARSGGYGPMRYHCGTVWPHDTAVAISGLVRSGHADAASVLVAGLLDAAPAFGFRLPELWSGDGRDEVALPVPYPAACRPQAWSAASAVAVLAALLGLDPDVPSGRLVVRPVTPSPVGALRVRGLTVGADRLDVEVGVDGAVTVAGGDGLTLVVG